MGWSWPRLWRRKAPGPAPAGGSVTLYTRRGCHLCERAWEVLERAQGEFRFALESVDVDSDPGLAARFGLEVPVVEVNGRVRFRGVVNEVLLNRLLRSEMKETHGERGA